jgi:hypothetical protein
MGITNKLISFLAIVQFLYGCTISKENYYSYKVGTYTIDTVKHFFYSDNLISYGDYLFEFKNRLNINRIIQGDSDATSTYYDTAGVYLLSGQDKLYFEFATFGLNNEVIKIGRLTDKQLGFKFNSLGTGPPSDGSFTPPEKTVINNINCFITEIISNNKRENDSIDQKIVLIKNKKFNSLFKINGIVYPDADYCIVGFHIYDLKNKENFLQDIESMRPLTEKEKSICAKMVERSKSCVVDTIK